MFLYSLMILLMIKMVSPTDKALFFPLLMFGLCGFFFIYVVLSRDKDKDFSLHFLLVLTGWLVWGCAYLMRLQRLIGG